MNNTDTLNIRIEPNIKKQAEKKLNDLGLTMTEAVKLFLRQVILTDSIPFAIKMPKYNKETMDAIEEAEKISEDPNVKGFKNVEDLFKELES
jgi:DNA-damage-inducible protein J